jgi:glucose/mannose-6-phosphate isomerase
VKDLISNFSDQIAEALDTIESLQLNAPKSDIHNVVITGLGGSGIGGTIVADLVSASATVPVVVNKDYMLPGFVGKNTLVIACSYSGNTEETLSATKHAINRGAEVACITSGGELFQIAKGGGYNVITMRGGNPPRSMFAYSFAFLCYYMEFYNIAPLTVKKDLAAAINLINGEEADTLIEAERMSSHLKGRIPAIYAVSEYLGVAARWRQQFNENAKMLSWEGAVPEMNHNELVGWEGGSNSYAAIFLRNSTDFKRNQKRIEINKSIIAEKTNQVLEINSKGSSNIERILYLVHFGDWVSYYLSEINKVDIMDIKSIDYLKSELSKLPV